MKISLDRLFQQKFALLRVISDLSCQYMQYILQLKFKDICLSQTQMKTQSNQMRMSKYLKVKLIMMIEVLEMIQTRQVTVKLKSYFPFSTKSSAAWKQFKKGHGPKTGFAKCKHCFKVLKTSGGSTKGLISHLLSAHHIVIPSSNNRAQPTKRQRTDSALSTKYPASTS